MLPLLLDGSSPVVLLIFLLQIGLRKAPELFPVRAVLRCFVAV